MMDLFNNPVVIEQVRQEILRVSMLRILLFFSGF
jgi:hypothetical protein